MSQRKQLTTLAISALDAANDELFKLALPSDAVPYSDLIKQIAQEKGVDPFLIAALVEHESGWGTLLSPPGPAGTADGGHGRGLAQIDDRTWASWLAVNDWTDPYTNVSKGVDILLADQAYFQGKGITDPSLLTRAALAAYNHGPGNVWANIQAGLDPDTGTAHGDYSTLVENILQAASSKFSQLVGSPADTAQA